MAIIKCPECGMEVSDKTTKCIHCGYKRTDSKKTKKVIAIILIIIIVIGIILMHNKNELEVFDKFQDRMTSDDFSMLFGDAVDRIEIEWENSAPTIRETYNYSIAGLDGEIYVWLDNGVYDGRVHWKYLLDSNENFSDYDEQIKEIYDYFEEVYGKPVYESKQQYEWKTLTKESIVFKYNYVFQGEKSICIEYSN